ncbi:MAG: DUF2079 domain-containing protein [Candidatus Bathyarchaeota archaeon]|nr:DUF2079 domain-containing protein [Candidatus Bathyarchaeota archaeon]
MGFSDYLKRYESKIIVFSSIIIYILALSLFTIAKHNNYTTYAWDLGIFDQAFWTTSNQNKVFEYTCELHLVESGSFFGIHFSPILFLLVPVYYLRQSATTLLIAQSIIIGLSAYPIYLIAKDMFKERVAALFSVIYLLNPALHGVNSYDFHVQSFLPLLFNYLLYYTLKRDRSSIIITFIFSLAVQEQVAYLMIAYTGFLMLNDRLDDRRIQNNLFRKNLGFYAFLFMMSISWIILSNSVIHYFNPNIPAHLKAGQHFAVLGVSEPSGIPLALILTPGRVLAAFSFDWFDKVVYLLILFTPYVFLSLLRPSFLVSTLPWFGISFLSNYPPYYRIGFQYPAYVVSFIVVSFMLGLEKLRDALKNSEKETFTKILTGVLILNLANAVAFSPVSAFTDGFHLSPAYIKPVRDHRTNQLDDIVKMVPRTASILTQDNVFPHVSNREQAYVIVPKISQDEVTWMKAMNLLMTLKTDYILVDLETDPHGTAETAFNLVELHNYSLVAYDDNIYLYQLEHRDEPLLLKPLQRTYLPSDLILMNAEITRDDTSPTGAAITYKHVTHKANTIWYGPYGIAPEGNYTATFNLKTLDIDETGAVILDIYSGGKTLHNITVTKENFSEKDRWTLVSLNFTLTCIATDLELRGFIDSNSTTIRLSHIQVTQR